MNRLTVYAPAKINLFLDITGKRQNGYHEIDSIMQTVDLCDVIDIELVGKDGIEVHCSSEFAPSGQQNIAWRAANAYLEQNNIKAGIKITVTKNIPSPAGLGGGSADAAAVLRGLNELFCAMSMKELEALAISIGSDVPFCVASGAQRVRGIGEALEKLPPIPPCYIVIACSGEAVHTPVAYKQLDVIYDNFSNIKGTKPIEKIMNAIENADTQAIASSMYNIFEDAVLQMCPIATKVKNIIANNGALGAVMTGSGASVFGIFDDLKTAEKALSAVREEGVFCTLQKTF